MSTRTVTGIVYKIDADLHESTAYADLDATWVPGRVTITARCGTADITYRWNGQDPHPRIGDPASFTITPTEDTTA